LLIRGSSNIDIQPSGGGSYMARFTASGAASLYHNGSEKLATTATGIDVTGNVSLPDNGKALFGAGSDLKIYHDGSNSIITDGGTGSLLIRGSNVWIQNADGTETGARFITDGAIDLRYDNAVKLATTATGIDVSGTVTADGLTVDNNSTTGAVKIQSGDTNTFGGGRAQIAFGYNATDDYQHFIRTAHDVTTAGNKLELLLSDGTQNNTITSGSNRVISFAGNGDISFYEDTGTTAKLFWDASAESLGIGTTSPDTLVHLSATADAALRFEATDTTINSGQYYGRLEFEGNDAGTSAGGIRARIDALSTGQNGESALVFNTSGVGSDSDNESMRIDSNGQVGIGTSSPDTLLHLSHATGGAVLRLERNDTDVVSGEVIGEIQFETQDVSGSGAAGGIRSKITAEAEGSAGQTALTFETAGIDSSLTERMRIDSSGNVGIGGSAVAGLHIQTSTRSLSLAPSATGGGGASYILMGNSDSGGTAGPNVIASGNRNLQFGVGDDFSSATGGTFSEYMRLDASGNLLVGQTSESESFVNVKVVDGGQAGITTTTLTGSSASTAIRFRNGNGVVGSIVTSGSATAYNTSSDQRLKDNIVNAPSASDDIDAIQVRSFDWKADGSHQKYGMVAHDLQSVAPEAVSGDADSDDIMGVDYSKLVPMMLKEIQSLRARVAQLEGEN
jgi:hypothetical protein